MRRWGRIRSKGKTFFVVSFSLLFVLLTAAYLVFNHGFSKSVIGFLLMATPVAFVTGVFLGVMYWEMAEWEFRKHLEKRSGVK
jgi:hypothetical protein